MHVRIWTALAVLVGVAGLVPLAAAAPRDEIRDRQAAIARAKAEHDRLGRALEPAIARYDAAAWELAAVRERVAENRTRIAAIRANTHVAREELSARLVEAYVRGDGDVVASLLAAGSVQDVLDLADLVRRSQRQASDLVASLRSSQAELRTREADLARSERRAAELAAQTAVERERIEQGMAAQAAAVRGYEAEIAELREQERERQRRIAGEARRRLAAEQAAQEAAAAASGPAPQIGGAAPTVDGGAVALPAPPATDGTAGARAVAAAMRWLGTPYSWGGGTASGPSRGIGRGAGTVGFDCSGLTLYAWAQVGVGLSHFTGSQWNEGARIASMGDLVPGDLVFFGGDLGHMGLYVGGGQMIHAPQTGDVVKISSIVSGYYASAFRGGVRPG